MYGSVLFIFLDLEASSYRTTSPTFTLPDWCTKSIALARVSALFCSSRGSDAYRKGEDGLSLCLSGTWEASW